MLTQGKSVTTRIRRLISSEIELLKLTLKDIAIHNKNEEYGKMLSFITRMEFMQGKNGNPFDSK